MQQNSHGAQIEGELPSKRLETWRWTWPQRPINQGLQLLYPHGSIMMQSCKGAGQNKAKTSRLG